MFRTTALNNRFDCFGGTSSSSATLTGIVGLIASKYPNINPDDAKILLKKGATPIDRYNPGYEGKLGAGLVNAYNSLNIPFTPTPIIPIVDATPPPQIIITPNPTPTPNPIPTPNDPQFAGIPDGEWQKQNTEADYYYHTTNCNTVGSEIVPFFIINKTKNFNFGCKIDLEHNSTKITSDKNFLHLASCYSESGGNSVLRSIYNNTATQSMESICGEQSRIGPKNQSTTIDLKNAEGFARFYTQMCYDRSINESENWTARRPNQIKIYKDSNGNLTSGFKNAIFSFLKDSRDCDVRYGKGYDAKMDQYNFLLVDLDRYYRKDTSTHISYSNCKVIDKNTPGSLLRVEITKGNSYYNSRDVYNNNYTDYDKYNICGNKVNINGNYKEEGSHYISSKIAYSTCQKPNGYYYTYFNSGKSFNECASSDGKTLDRSVVTEEYEIQYNSIMHFSNCQSKTNWKDIIAEIKFDTDPSIINLCSKYTDRVLVEANQSINLNPFGDIQYSRKATPVDPKIPFEPGQDWQLQPSSDFNSDGNVDVLWRNKADGTLVIWYLNGKGNFLSGTNNPVAGDATIAGVKVDQSSGWNISTIGDINGDGNKDIVWHNSISGDRVIWYLNTQRQIVSGDTLPYPSKEWEIVGSTDTNNDNKDDLIFRHKTAGHIVVWRSNRIINAKGENEYQILGGALLTTFSDYNAKIYGAYQSQLQKGTNQYTIQWYYTDGPAKGQKVEWYMNGLTFKSGTNDTTKSVAGIDYAGVK
jgi:hypothetical protein